MNDETASDGTSSRELRVGLIGAGKMGVQHARVIAGLPGVSLVGIADPTADEDALRGTIPSSASIVANASDLLETTSPDVVHIVTPPHTHAELAMSALEHGAHVYLEKPFAPTRVEAERILEVAAEQGLKVVAGHQCLFEKPSLLSARMLGDVGRIVHVESFLSFRTARRSISPVDQCEDILPHAVYPLVARLREATGSTSEEIEVTAVDAAASGDVYALLRLGDCVGLLAVTLSGRPVEQYQSIVGSNGSLRADYIIGSVIRLTGPGAGIGVLFTPYRRALQTLGRATVGFAGLALRGNSYAGLRLLIERFYESVRSDGPAPMTPQSIIDTVALCERVGTRLKAAEHLSEERARLRLEESRASLPRIETSGGTVLVTGGTGMLGRSVVAELRYAGFDVRALGRRIPAASRQVPGVQYSVADLACALDSSHLEGVRTIVHCAAETAGGKREHERNSVDATRHVIESAAQAGVENVIHVSSLAVLKPGGRGPTDENSPVDAGNLDRGPYVWGKAESEVLAQTRARELGIRIRVIRPGPLVDFADFHPPGRLGREIGPFYVAVGPRNSPLAVCDVATMARVIRSYVQSFDDAPPLLNMIEAPPPTRKELVARLKKVRGDLRVIWLPAWVLRLLNLPLKLLQRFVFGASKPIDVYQAFASEKYRPETAARVIERAGSSTVPR